MPSIIRPPRRRVESTILAKIRRWASTQPDVTLWRNNIGTLRDITGRAVSYGLAPGSADLVGCLSVWCTDPRRCIARLLSVEVKRPGQKPRPEQEAWLEVVRRAGGIAGVVTSVAEAASLVERGRRWEV